MFTKYSLFLSLLVMPFTSYAIPGHSLCYYEDNHACCDETPLGWCLEDNKMIFKVLRVNEWNQFKVQGQFAGSEHDQRDGFIHLASGDQLSRVLKKYFKDEPVYIAGYQAEDFGENLLWENSYPHLYEVPLLIGQTIGPGYYFVNNKGNFNNFKKLFSSRMKFRYHLIHTLK